MISLYGKVNYKDSGSKDDIIVNAIDNAINDGESIPDDSMVACMGSLSDFRIDFRVVYDPEYIANFYNECVNGGISVETVGELRRRRTGTMKG